LRGGFVRFAHRYASRRPKIENDIAAFNHAHESRIPRHAFENLGFTVCRQLERDATLELQGPAPLAHSNRGLEAPMDVWIAVDERKKLPSPSRGAFTGKPRQARRQGSADT
jgi:hypothetical protein